MGIKWESMESAHLVGAQCVAHLLNILTPIFKKFLIRYGFTGGFAASLIPTLS